MLLIDVSIGQYRLKYRYQFIAQIPQKLLHYFAFASAYSFSNLRTKGIIYSET